MGFLDELRVDQEVAHTRLLAWLLNPSGDHELGTRALSAFWRIAGLGKIRRGLRFAEVHVEEREDETRADIVIVTERVYVLVENKIRWSAFNEWQIGAHAKSGSRKATRDGKKFKLVLLLPDDTYRYDNHHGPTILEIRRRLGAEIISWDDIVREFRKLGPENRATKAPGLMFLHPYCEFVEREILRKWKGFNMQVIDKDTVAALSTYLGRRNEFLKELKDFAESVRVQLGLWRDATYHEETEKQYGKKDLYVYTRQYRFQKYPKTAVDLSFCVTERARSVKGLTLWLSFWTANKDVINIFKRRGLDNRRAFNLKFKNVSGSGVIDEELWVENRVPQQLWLTSDQKTAAAGAKAIADILRCYLKETQKILGGFA
jgi:hypothetical protein